ncbi:hypothetical protein [Flavobacterium sp.]|uniref:hypothetical protein n=1 Tax=Flavobacterium sp. TaxID=239 RepID=UPI003D0F9D3E
MKKIVFAALLLTVSVSFAQQREDMNLRGEKRRVANGIKSGEINKHEAKVIENKAEQLQHVEAKAKADGEITAKERAKIARKDAQLDRTIHKTKHNRR